MHLHFYHPWPFFSLFFFINYSHHFLFPYLYWNVIHRWKIVICEKEIRYSQIFYFVLTALFLYSFRYMFKESQFSPFLYLLTFHSFTHCLLLHSQRTCLFHLCSITLSYSYVCLMRVCVCVCVCVCERERERERERESERESFEEKSDSIIPWGHS